MKPLGRPPSLRVSARPQIRIVPLGLACCAVEVDAAVADGLLLAESSDDPVPEATVVVIAGTVTEPLKGLLESACADQPGPTSVMAFGACASTGGPYWDAPSVVNGADALTEVTSYVPGCPPRPGDLVDALLAVVDA